MNSSITNSDRTISPLPRRARRRLVVLLITLLVTLTAIAGANAIVDPYGVFPGLSAAALRDYESKRGSRTAKAADLARDRHDIIFFGSSRTETGFDPRLAFIPGKTGYNAALAGTSMWELDRVYRFAAERNRIGTAVFALDFFMFAQGRGDFDDYLQSRFNPDRRDPAYTLDLLLSQRALSATVSSIRASLAGRESNYDNAGFRAGGMVETMRTSVEISRSRIRGFRRGVFADFRFDDDAFAVFSEIVEGRARDGHSTIILVPPVHALHLELVRDAGLWDEFEGFKRRLASLARPAGDGGGVRVFDFTGYNRYTTEPLPLDDPSRPMRWYWETSHFRAELGGVVLGIVFGAEEPPGHSSFGRSLDAASIEEHLEAVRAERAAWAETAGADLEWFAGVVDKP